MRKCCQNQLRGIVKPDGWYKIANKGLKTVIIGKKYWRVSKKVIIYDLYNNAGIQNSKNDSITHYCMNSEVKTKKRIKPNWF